MCHWGNGKPADGMLSPRLSEKLKNLFRARVKFSAADFENPPLPTEDIVVIGDIHGRLDLLQKILAEIADKAPDHRLVFVGDYVDRGPSSKDVLVLLAESPNAPVFLMGNHEVMMLEFLTDPESKSVRWLRHGGLATLDSFGISLDETADLASILDAHARLKAALSDGTEDWLRSLAMYWQSGNLVVTHAGPDPQLSIELQDKESFLWGHQRFLRDERKDGLWVAHGHWIVDQPTCSKGRIAVDIGAWRTGKLAAACLTQDGDVEFIKVHE